MIRALTKAQLAAFAIITIVGVSILSANYVGLTERLLGGGPRIKASFAQSGGIFVGSEVTYRGVKVGRVTGLELEKDGVLVEALLDRGTKVPKDTRAVVENRSAVGEQYLDLQPRSFGGPVLASGDTISRKDTAYPLRVDQLLLDLDRTVASVDKDDLRTVVDELGTAFDGAGPDLSRLIDNGDLLTQAAIDALPETIGLLRASKTVLDTQRATSPEIKNFATDFANLSETLQASDADLRLILDRGVVASKELETLVKENQQNLGVLIANLITIGQVTTSRIDGIEQMLVTYPEVVIGGYTVVPGDGTAHFGMQLAEQPPTCTKGYEGTKKTDPNQTTNLPPLNTKAGCTLPRGSASNVRGAQNAPAPRSGVASSYPVAMGGQMVPLGNKAVSEGMPLVSTPLAPTGGASGADSWSWIMEEAAR
ncbi:phospholipid/cholesterol/gamma-HCH transport system substrate-binding protein [Knoellia remsis]|uniref:Phospholipid/cholesterol/gamma-HCH transport system substrate-binding protein n=1 Tax=Knoellia remsis TaxID=407159 RepID=A0A2T0UI43_9MICO|nr:MlaD family protein [Knoellia remsis]PRY57507.1 phospholipid/cholesterol/gamma-HCH transport system substrate-binding protein [Knoellia remsis]